MFTPLLTVEQLKTAIGLDVYKVKRTTVPSGTVSVFHRGGRGYLFQTQLFGDGEGAFSNGTGASIYYRHHPYVVLTFQGNQWCLQVNGETTDDVDMYVSSYK